MVGLRLPVALLVPTGIQDDASVMDGADSLLDGRQVSTGHAFRGLVGEMLAGA
jgi:hypothetical protein